LNTVKAALKELINAGWIEKEQIRVDGMFSHSIFTLFYEVSTVDQKSVSGKLPTTNTDSNNTREEKEENQKDMHDFQNFRKQFIKDTLENHEPFEVYDGGTYYFNLDGYLMDVKTTKFVTKSKTFKIWDYLYKNKENYNYAN